MVDSAFSLQWLPAGPMEQINRADALASCINCTTVAVAFQVLIADNPAEPAAPQNLAVAANVECDACLTRAVAVQLVVALDSSPSDEARNQIATWWSRLDALERDAGNLSPEEIHVRLLVIRTAILEILAPYGDALPLRSDIAGHSSDDVLEGPNSPPAQEVPSGTALPDQSDDPLADTELVNDERGKDQMAKDEVADERTSAVPWRWRKSRSPRSPWSTSSNRSTSRRSLRSRWSTDHLPGPRSRPMPARPRPRRKRPGGKR